MRLARLLTTSVWLLGPGRSAIHASATNLEIFEELAEAPRDWIPVGEAASNQVLQFKLALHAAIPGALQGLLKRTSDPHNPGYGRHLTRSELRNVNRPSNVALTSVTQWLRDAGVDSIARDNDWMYFNTTVKTANVMLNTTFRTYRHTSKISLSIVRTTKVALPQHISPFLKFIHPTTRFEQMHELGRRVLDGVLESTAISKATIAVQSTAESCTDMVTPACLRQLYRIGNFSYPQSSRLGTIAVAGFLEEYARFKDLEDFLQLEAPWAASANFSWSSVNGGLLDQQSREDSIEANLDVQYAIALSYPVKAHFYSTAGRAPLLPDLDQPTAADNENEPYLDFFQRLLEEPTVPHTISISYGENEQSLPLSYARTVCDMIGQLSLRGASVIISSGDVGAGSACQTNDGRNATRFQAIFPAACPFATSVGGVSGVNPERAAVFSSGGFSDVWDRPWYQDQAVSQYLKGVQGNWSKLYNPRGRGFPDLAAQSQHFRFRDKGRFARASGTSASAPVVAGIIASLNAVRLSRGQPSLGFLNPWLYSTGANLLNDITEGKSMGCTGTSAFTGLPVPFVPGAGWPAAKGWDAVTGLGTPDFERMLAALPKGYDVGYLPVPDGQSYDRPVRTRQIRYRR